MGATEQLRGPSPVPSGPEGWVPSRDEADWLAEELLGEVDHRLQHVRTAADVAASLAPILDPDELRLLVAAATLHDIGYAPSIARTRFHPLDGAVYLREHGYSDRLAGLVAHHSHAYMTAPSKGIDDLCQQFPRERSLVADALVYADMHSNPNGARTTVAARFDDMHQRHGERYSPERAEKLRRSIRRVEEALAHAGAAPVQRQG